MTKGRSFFLGLMVITGVLSSAREVVAASKAPAAPSCDAGGSPAITTARPIRRVVLQPIGTKAFPLPNGARVDLSVDLQSILNTATTSSNSFSPTDPSTVNPCESHIEIRSAVTNFQLNVAEAGVTFGFSPAGALGPVTSITGSANVKIGTIAMDFSVWDCVGARCSAIAASTATHLTAGVNLSMVVNFTIANTAASFLYNTPVGDAMRQIMISGINQMAASPRFNALPWEAEVKEYIPSAGMVIFDQGFQAGLKVNQAFEVYAPTDSSTTGKCNVFQVVSDIHTTAVDTVSSTALVDKMLDGTRGVMPGDVVMIRNVSGK